MTLLGFNLGAAPAPATSGVDMSLGTSNAPIEQAALPSYFRPSNVLLNLT